MGEAKIGVGQASLFRVPTSDLFALQRERDLLLETELGEITHALGIEDPVNVVTLVLDDTGVKVLCLACEMSPFTIEA